MREFSGNLRLGRALELETDPALEVYRAPDLTVAVSRHTRSPESAENLAHAYRARGASAIASRDEDSAVILFDDRSRTLILARDFVGMTPMYYATAHGDFAFGTRITDVIAQLELQCRPNLTALASQLVYRSAPPPGQTCFEDAFALPPGHVLIHSGGELSIAPAEVIGVPPQRWTFDDAAAEFGRVLRDAVGRAMAASGPTAVFVSGGLDSSALVCLAAGLGEVVAINYGFPGDAGADETRYLDALRAAGIRIEHVPFLPTTDVASGERAVLQTEAPVMDLVPATLARAAARSVELGAHTILNGTWGDQVLSPFPPAHHRAIAPWRVARLARAYQRSMTDVPHAQIARALRRHALRMRAPEWLLQRRREQRRRHSLFDGLATAVGEFGPVDRTGSYREAIARNVFSAPAVQGIETTTKWGNAHGIDARLPFLDRGLVRFLMQLPDEIAYHNHTLKPLLRASMKGVVPDPVLHRTDKGDYTEVMRANALPASVVLDLLDDLRRPVQLGLMSRQKAQQTLARIHRGTEIWDESGDLPLLLGLDVWLRLFFEK